VSDHRGKAPQGADDTPSANRAVVAGRIREARKLAGLSQGQVAKLLGLHRPSVSEIEAGNRRVAVEEIKTLADLFDVSVAWLVGEAAATLEADDPKVQLAARELKKLKPAELDNLLSLLAKLRDPDRKTVADRESRARGRKK
jgi:transcriptional regulator with XRE-family HTH domain